MERQGDTPRKTRGSRGHELQARTKRFALRVIRLVGELPARNPEALIGGQLLRAGTSVGANHRSAGRARSKRDNLELKALREEACELAAIFTTSILTAKGRRDRES